MSANMKEGHLALWVLRVMFVRGRTLSFHILSPRPSKTMLLLEAKVVIRSPLSSCYQWGKESVALFTTMYLWAALAPRRCKTEESGFRPSPGTEIDYYRDVSPSASSCCFRGMGGTRIIWPQKSGGKAPNIHGLRMTGRLQSSEECDHSSFWGEATAEDCVA